MTATEMNLSAPTDAGVTGRFWLDVDVPGNRDPWDPYVEVAWLPIIGPSSFLLWRRLVGLLRETNDRKLRLDDLFAQIGLSPGTGRNSPGMHTLVRLERFRFLKIYELHGELVVVVAAKVGDARPTRRHQP